MRESFKKTKTWLLDSEYFTGIVGGNRLRLVLEKFQHNSKSSK